MLDKKSSGIIKSADQQRIYSCLLYLDFSSFIKTRDWTDLPTGTQVQAQEERDHAMLFYQYLHNNNVRPVLEAVDKPSVPMENLKDPLEAGLRHEEYVTGLIHNIYAAAQEVRDFRTTPVPGLVCEGAGGRGDQRQ